MSPPQTCLWHPQLCCNEGPIAPLHRWSCKGPAMSANFPKLNARACFHSRTKWLQSPYVPHHGGLPWGRSLPRRLQGRLAAAASSPFNYERNESSWKIKNSQDIKLKGKVPLILSLSPSSILEDLFRVEFSLCRRAFCMQRIWPFLPL